VDGEELIVGVVEEDDLIGDVHANWVANECFASRDVPDDELVVILAAERGQELLIG